MAERERPSPEGVIGRIGVFYIWVFRSRGVAKLGRSKHGALARRDYAVGVVQRTLGSADDPALIVELATDDPEAEERWWRTELRARGGLPLWGRRDFYRLEEIESVLAHHAARVVGP